jgi:hypothetical protein
MGTAAGNQSLRLASVIIIRVRRMMINMFNKQSQIAVPIWALNPCKVEQLTRSQVFAAEYVVQILRGPTQMPKGLKFQFKNSLPVWVGQPPSNDLILKYEWVLVSRIVFVLPK